MLPLGVLSDFGHLGAESPETCGRSVIPSIGTPRVTLSDALCLLDCLSFGIAWVCPAGNLVGSNSAARAHLKAGRALQLARGIVAPVDQLDVPAWNQSLQRAFQCRREYLTLCRRSAPFAVSLLPTPEYGQDRAGLVAIVFDGLESRGSITLQSFARSHGLTPAEQLVLNMLRDGRSTVEAAQAIGSSVHTVRTHVRSILSKTAEPNLRKLLCRVGALPPVGSRGSVVGGESMAGIGKQGWRGACND